MSLAKWQHSVKIAKVKLGMDQKKFVKIKGKLLKEAQKIYSMLLLKQSSK